MFRVIVTIAFLAVAAQAQIRGGGGCPSVSGQTLVDFKRLLGNWYEQYRYSSDAEIKTACGSVNFEMTGLIVKATFKQVDIDTKQETTQVATGAFETNTGKLTLTFSWGVLSYTIVKTDMSSYIIMFDCTGLPFWQNSRNAVILTREKFARPGSLSAALQGFVNTTLEIDALKNSAQYRCPLPRFQ